MSRLPRSPPFRPKLNRRADIQTSMFAAVLFVLAVSQIATNTDGAAVEMTVVRVIRVDVPPLVRAYNAKPDPGEPQPPPLLLTCAYRLQGGEKDREDGEEALSFVNTTELEELAEQRFTSPEPELVIDEAILENERHRGLVIKWYYRPNPVPNNDPMYSIDPSEQVYQWIADGGPGSGGALGTLSGHMVDITEQTPRIDKSALHRVIRVDRPTANLTGQYRCQVEDWRAERRSSWFTMIVYTPERVFKVIVNDNDDDDEHDIAEVSGDEESSTTPVAPTTSSTAPTTSAKNMPTEINITCYAAGMNPEPSMSIWVNGVKQDSVTTVIKEDDGDDDESNDDIPKNYTTTTTTTTAKPRHRGRQRHTEPFIAYSIRAEKVVALKDVEEYRTGKQPQQRRRNTIEVECRLRVPGEQHWSYVDRRGKLGRYYSARKTVSYKYRADQQSPSDAFAAMSSASSVADVGVDGGDRHGNNDGDGNEEDAKNTGGFFLNAPNFFLPYMVVVLHLAQAALFPHHLF